MHFNINDFYNLRKVKYTLDFGNKLNDKKLIRSQFVYTLDLKDTKEITALLEQCKQEGHKRVYMDLGLHIKYHKVHEICIL